MTLEWLKLIVRVDGSIEYYSYWIVFSGTNDILKIRIRLEISHFRGKDLRQMKNILAF